MITDVGKIQVRYRDIVVGTLQMDRQLGTCVFEYDKAWLAEGFSLSPAELPLQSGLFYADKAKFDGGFAIFHDCLPDGYGLYLLDRMLRRQNASLEELSPLQRLSIIGKSGMGALTFLPIMDGFQLHQELAAPEQLDYLQEEALKVLSEKEAGDAALLYYNSANSGGARPKTAFLAEDGTHWLVKFRHVYDAVDAGKQELLYMETARECGVAVPRMRLMNDRYFASERFDFDADGQKLHVATAAALLKVDFRSQSVDYTNILALTGYLTQNPGQVEEMFRRMVFNLVAINKDDHAKNFSFICRDGRWELAPAYDITYSPAGVNGEHSSALFFNGNPGLDLVLKAGTEIRIPKARCLEMIEQVESVCEKRLPIINRLK